MLPHVHGVSARARDAADRSSGQVALSTDYQKAVIAAGTEAVNLLTYSRKSFAADWTRSARRRDRRAAQGPREEESATDNMTTNKVDHGRDLQQ